MSEKEAKYGKIDKDMFEFVRQDATVFDAKFEGKPVGFYKDAMLRLGRNRSAIAGGVVICFIIFMSIFGPFMSPYTFRAQNISHANLPPRIPGLENLGVLDGHKTIDVQQQNIKSGYGHALIKVLRTYDVVFRGKTVTMARIEVDAYKLAGAENNYYYFGTDSIGRDLWTRLWRGARVSLMIGIMATLLNTSIGVVYGAIAGYYGGKLDMVMQRIIEVLGGLPMMVIMILFVIYFGAGMFTFVMALILVGWIGTSRLIRAQFYKYKGHEYVLASRTMGASDKRLIFRHILPNALGTLITGTILAIPGAIFTESFLSMLGLGIQAPEPSIGMLLADGQKVILSYPYMALIPAAVISILMLAFNTFGNGLRDAFDPSLRGR